MDERQTKIREGAGLEESRINTEFVDFLKKWGPRLLTVLILVSAVWLALRYRSQQQDQQVAAAFEQLRAASAMQPASPESLIAIAEQFSGVRGVPHMARLEAADAYLDAVRRGMVPGALMQPGGTVDEADLLDEQGRAENLAAAGSLYETVYNATRSNADMAQHAIGAAFGLAAVAESRANAGEARRWYEAARVLAQASGMVELAEAATARMADVDEAISAIVLLSSADLPEVPGEAPLPTLPPETVAPELSAPDTPAETGPAGPEPLPQQPASEPTGDAPTSDQPASDPPASDPPAGGEPATSDPSTGG